MKVRRVRRPIVNEADIIDGVDWVLFGGRVATTVLLDERELLNALPNQRKCLLLDHFNVALVVETSTFVGVFRTGRLDRVALRVSQSLVLGKKTRLTHFVDC